MEKEILEKIKQDINETKQWLETDLAEMEELEKNPIVARYARLVKLKYELDHGLHLDSDDAIGRHEFWKYTQGNIKETNDIWFLLGEYTSDSYREYYGETTKEANVLVYINLENEFMHQVIGLDGQKSFEACHRVIKSERQNNWGMYYKIRDEFFVSCINDGQDIAVQKVLSKNKKNQ